MDKTTGIAVKARAEALRKKWELDIERGELDGTKPLTFADAALAFVESGGETRFLKRITHHFGDKTYARDITQGSVDALATKLYPQGTPATRARQVYAPISAILKHNGVPLDLRRPKGSQSRRREVWLQPPEAELVIACATEIDVGLGVLMLLGLFTGMRLGEMLGLTWGDVSFEDQTATVLRTKNGDPRVAYLPPRVCAAMASIGPGISKARVFRFTRNGRLNNMAHSAYNKAGVDCGGAPFHILRHTFASWMNRLGADLIGAKVWRSATSARRYTHFVVSDEAKKAEMLPGALEAVKCLTRKN